ncbi:unnamed protein product [Eruca vesicaria subsp. sativa]|uniref:Replication protein A 70 kDa DNA-binding subunit B/D first OB fold domain-containing protein n=1 Tax=Eruca vesicaria subsp. sativa TaxID=29727 RepID=A0ABC8L0A4_ERUVS|nr:unnamed protein product [Eruca vesicaria subsp. sativa]
MAPKAKNFINDIKPWKTEWCINVKAVHSWRQQTKFGGDSLEMILADETVSILNIIINIICIVSVCNNISSFFFQGAKIHASCKQGFVPKVQRDFPINQWRVIDTFFVSPAKGHYRTTAHPYRISITNDTSFSSSDVKIDNLFLSLASFKSISSGDLDPDFLIGKISYFICLLLTYNCIL